MNNQSSFTTPELRIELSGFILEIYAAKILILSTSGDWRMELHNTHPCYSTIRTILELPNGNGVEYIHSLVAMIYTMCVSLPVPETLYAMHLTLAKELYAGIPAEASDADDDESIKLVKMYEEFRKHCKEVN